VADQGRYEAGWFLEWAVNRMEVRRSASAHSLYSCGCFSWYEQLAPAAPFAVVGTAGTRGSGLITLRWQQDWLGWGQFQGFLITEKPTGKSMAVAGSLRTVTFSGLAEDTYIFQVTARGEYNDTESKVSSPVILLAAPIPARPLLAAPAPARPSCGRLIDVNLSTESLVASNCGTVYLSSLITSGMPGLRTPTGSFSIFLKQRNVYFYSPWPASSKYYYPPMFVAYAEEFARGGYYLHTDPNEPAGAYGPGSQNGPYASHGCVHVPYGVMARLYAWAPYGTRVYIHY
jgi:L,D-transpeptidase catalytic domain